MPALISALIFLLFAGLAANPNPAAPGKNFIPGIGQSKPIDCISETASQGTPTLFNIPKPNKNNVSFIGEDTSPWACPNANGNCDINPWNGETVPEKANYVPVAENVIIEKIWPHADTTRLMKQLLPTDSSDPLYDPSFDQNDLRNRVYRPTCNDWCHFIPPKRTPALPYGGTFFCDFVFFYQGQNTGNVVGERKYSSKNTLNGPEDYPDDTQCDPKNNFENCPVFNILIREKAPVPDVAGGAAPGSDVTPLKCELKNATPTPVSQNKSPFSFLSNAWIEDNAQTPGSFIILPTGDGGENEEWIFSAEVDNRPDKIIADKSVDPNGREQVINNSINFRGKDYLVFFNLVTRLSSENIVYLIEQSELDEADNERTNNYPNPDSSIHYLYFHPSQDIHPGGRTLQLGTFPVAVPEGWWELFPQESKPAIYLYPEKPVALNVRLATKGRITVSDPPYNPQTGWDITAYPNGKLSLLTSSTSYPYLYYEAVLDQVRIEPEGFIIEGKNLVSFFQKTLSSLGLNKRETADFIEYWMTRLSESQPYYFIHFLSDEQIEELEPLEITNSQEINFPADTSIRIRPYFKPLNAPIAVKPQTLPKALDRTGFTLVEWGGILVNE